MAGEPPYYYPQPQPVPAPYPMAMSPVPPPPQVTPPSRLAVAALVTSLVALVGVLVLAAGLVGSGAPMFGGGGGDDVLTGTVERVSPNGALAGPDLKAAVQARIEDDDGDVTAMTCPDTPRVAQGVVTVCHGSIDRSEWAIVVLFEDDKGAYTLLPI